MERKELVLSNEYLKTSIKILLYGFSIKELLICDVIEKLEEIGLEYNGYSETKLILTDDKINLICSLLKKFDKGMIKIKVLTYVILKVWKM